MLLLTQLVQHVIGLAHLFLSIHGALKQEFQRPLFLSCHQPMSINQSNRNFLSG